MMDTSTHQLCTIYFRCDRAPVLPSYWNIEDNGMVYYEVETSYGKINCFYVPIDRIDYIGWSKKQ